MFLEHAILAILDYQPMSGYDLKKFFDASVAHFWSATKSHIYKALDVLEQNGWSVSQIIVQENKPNRKEYRITPEGRAELRRWLVTPLAFEPLRHGWLIQIFFSHLSTNQEIISLLETRMENIRAQLHALQNDAQASIDENAASIGIERTRELWQITLDYGMNTYQAELAWLEKTVERVRALPPFEPPRK